MTLSASVNTAHHCWSLWFWSVGHSFNWRNLHHNITPPSCGGASASLQGRWWQYLWTGQLSWWCLFTTRGIKLYSNYRRITLLFLLGKVSSRGQERRMWLILQPQIQENQCGFCPSCGTLDQLHTFHRVLEGPWEFAQPVHMCFVDLKKAFNLVPRGIMWEVLKWRKWRSDWPTSSLLLLYWS